MVGKVAYQQSANQQLCLVQVCGEGFLLGLDTKPSVTKTLHTADQTEVFAKLHQFLERGLTIGLRLLQIGEGSECWRSVHDTCRARWILGLVSASPFVSLKVK